MTAEARGQYPLGGSVTLAGLEGDPHPLLAVLREREPVSWLPALGGWLVTRRDLALRVLRDATRFTVDDARFSTARVVGPSMLSLDGAEHDRHRGPFSHGFSRGEVHARLEAYVDAEAERLVTGMRPAGAADLRTGLAGPLSVAVVAQALGLGQTDPSVVLSWYGAIVDAVSELARRGDAGVSSAGSAAFGMLSSSLRAAIAAHGRSTLLGEAAAGESAAGESAAGEAAAGGGGAGEAAAGGRALETGEVVSNAAVLMFGGIETTEGMITNAVLHLLSHPDQLSLVRGDPGLVPGAVEESLRLEPAAAVVDRYATCDIQIGGAAIRRGDLVTVSLAGAGRDPTVFPDPDRFDVRRGNARLHLAFARGPHFCLGAHLASLEAQAAVRALLRSLPGLRLDPERPSAPRGLVFRKPPSLHVLWDPGIQHAGGEQF